MTRAAVFIIIGVLVLALVGFIYSRNNDEGTLSQERTIEGSVDDVALSARVFTMRQEEDGTELNVALVPETRIFDENGSPADLTYLKPGFRVETKGALSQDDTLIPQEVRVIETPDVIISWPEEDASVGQKFTVRGSARVAPNQVRLRVTSDGATVAEQTFAVAPREAGGYGDFEREITIPATSATRGDRLTLEIAPAAGNAEDAARIALVYNPGASAQPPPAGAMPPPATTPPPSGQGNTPPPPRMTPPPAQSGVLNYAGFLTELRKIATVTVIGSSQSQSAIGGTGYAITVNGERVQIFEFSTEAQATARSRQVSADGTKIGTQEIPWKVDPHFFRKGRLIVVYGGSNASVMNALERVLGKQFAGK